MGIERPALKRAAHWKDIFLDLVFPPVCAACGRLGPIICAECTAKLAHDDGPTCSRCGRETAVTTSSCAFCRKSDFNLHQARSCFAYREPLIVLIHRYKYDSLFALAEPLGTWMVRLWPEWDSEPDMIIPIPLHPRRLRVRGFNQARLLAEQLGRAVGLEVDSQLLSRVRYTRPQVGLSRLERQQNVSGAFEASSDAAAGRHVLLVDDVFTTGTTMFSAAKTLLAAGATAVSAYCLARAVQ